MTPLKDARAALHHIVRATTTSRPDFAPHLAALLDYLDNQVPLNIENQDLRARLAHAEGFMQRVEELSAVARHQVLKTPPVVVISEKVAAHLKEAGVMLRKNTGQTELSFYAGFGKMGDNASFNCVAHLNGDGGCLCHACRVRSNA